MKDFRKALEDAKKDLEANDFEHINNKVGKNVSYLANYIQDQDYRKEIINFIPKGFDILREAAERQSKEKIRPNTFKLIDDKSIVELANLAQLIGEKNLAPTILKEFIFTTDDEKDYSLNTAGGYLAVTLSILDYDKAIDTFNNFLKCYEYRYTGEVFVLKVRYAMWMIKKDKAEAIRYLKNPLDVVIGWDGKIGAVSGNPNRSLGWVFAALADLNAKESLSLLNEFKCRITNPVSAECLFEAISRLECQKNPPLPKDRMIWLFGIITDNALIKGEESDNVFVKRAREKTKNHEIGRIVETDESAASDII